MKRFCGISIVLFGSLYIACLTADNPLSPGVDESVDSLETGTASVTIALGRVGSLAKTRTINLTALYLSLTACGEQPVYDTICLSGHDNITVNKTYPKLATEKQWVCRVITKDEKGKIIHSGSTTFTVLSCQTATVVLSLDAVYSMLVADFFPIRDSITTCELRVDRRLIADSTFEAQSLSGDTLRLDFDYLKACPGGTNHVISMNVYGVMWGEYMLMYTGDTTISVYSGRDMRYRILLKWVGLNSPPWGDAAVTVSLGKVGTSTMLAELEDPGTIISDCSMFNTPITCDSAAADSMCDICSQDDTPASSDEPNPIRDQSIPSEDGDESDEYCWKCDRDRQASRDGYILKLKRSVTNVLVDFEITGDDGQTGSAVCAIDCSIDGREWKRLWIKQHTTGKLRYREKIHIPGTFHYMRAVSEGQSLDNFTIVLSEEN